jgi:hypothetical protein
MLEVLSHESETWTWSLQEHVFLFMDIRLLVLMDMISIDEIDHRTSHNPYICRWPILDTHLYRRKMWLPRIQRRRRVQR